MKQKLYSVDQTRIFESYAIETLGIPEFVLMQRAGQAIMDCLGDISSLTVLCGQGNNGGDGYIVAALAMQKMKKVSCLAIGEPKTVLAKKAQEYAISNGVVIQPFSMRDIPKNTVIIDAIFGIGVRGQITGNIREAIEYVNSLHNSYVIAVDIPSGLDGDTGQIHSVAIKANHTVTFIALKQGLYLGVGKDYCGSIEFNDLGVESDLDSDSLHQDFQTLQKKISCSNHALSQEDGTLQNKIFEPQYLLTHTEDLSILQQKRTCLSHKGDFGHILLVGGSLGMGGAIIMAAEAALLTGVGKVTVATHQNHVAPLLSRRPEIMTCDFENMDLEDKTAIVIGPGLGRMADAYRLYEEIIKSDKPKVIDADALYFLSQNPQKFQDSILTPHPAEAARLLNTDVISIQEGRRRSLYALMELYGSTIVLKGNATLVSGKTPWLCPYGNSAMASAGMGDILTGIIGGIVAQGLTPERAACLGVSIHGLAGVLASEKVPFVVEEMSKLRSIPEQNIAKRLSITATELLAQISKFFVYFSR